MSNFVRPSYSLRVLPIKWAVRSLYNPQPLSPIYVWDAPAQAYINYQPLYSSTDEAVAWLRSKGRAVMVLRPKNGALNEKTK